MLAVIGPTPIPRAPAMSLPTALAVTVAVMLHQKSPFRQYSIITQSNRRYRVKV